MDGMSEDGTRQVVEGLARQNPSVRLLGDPDRTVRGAQNNALKVARGQWLVRLDAQSTPSHQERFWRGPGSLVWTRLTLLFRGIRVVHALSVRHLALAALHPPPTNAHRTAVFCGAGR